MLCSNNRVTQIHINNHNLTGSLPPDLKNLSLLAVLHATGNFLSGPIPSLARLSSLQYVYLSNNQFTSIPTDFFSGLTSLKSITLGFNPFRSWQIPESLKDATELQTFSANLANISGSIPDFLGADNFPRLRNLLLTGNNLEGPIPSQVFGPISSDFSMLTSIENLILSNNALTGTIPNELTFLPNLKMLDVSNNYLSGEVPKFRQTVIVKSDGNPNIVRNNSYPGATPENNSGQNQRKGTGKDSNTGIVLVPVMIGAAFGLFIVGLGFCLYKKKQKLLPRIHRPKTVSKKSQDAMISDIQLLGVGNFVFSIKVLREMTNNFREQNILGRGGFGTAYGGEFRDGTKVAVKRMEIEILSERRLKKFKSEIAVLTKVRHRHLVALLGYCLDGEERLLVYEFMSQGTLNRHLFNWKDEGLKPLEWSRRLIIALDVARGIEYLHGLAHESFIHRDLKPSNILLDHDIRAKVADFGLARLAPENGKHSTETRIAGTFGYLAPEYLVTGRVTTKVNVFSFGVILMELITVRKAINESDDSDPENIVYLVTWFRTVHINQDTFRMAVDETIELDNGTLASVRKVAELAEQCCASEPYRRPDMARVVNVLSSLAELWKPCHLQIF
ncbi:hypothetical protein CICLE_v10017453mg, partial [Citrus x clementina]